MLVEETWFWSLSESDEKSRVLEVVRLQVLSPFLFSQQLLCDKVSSPNSHFLWKLHGNTYVFVFM